jgi:hypothetical protein
MILIPEYWHAVARGIDAENDKATIFIHHNASLGVAREAILRKVIIDHTPEPFKVQTGFVCHVQDNIDTGEQSSPWMSRQYDLLVHDPWHSRPFYAIDQLVVVPRRSARCVVEVKSYLGKRAFEKKLEIWRETAWIPVPTFGFAYDGLKFTNFVQRLATAVKNNQRGVPQCLVVHRKNYIFFRSVYRLAPTKQSSRLIAKHQFGIDFGNQKKHLGSSTAIFLELYSRWLKNSFDHVVESELLYWFNRLELAEESKISIDDEGKVNYGSINDGTT